MSVRRIPMLSGRIPEDCSARLEMGTVNGSIDIDFPVTVQGVATMKLPQSTCSLVAARS